MHNLCHVQTKRQKCGYKFSLRSFSWTPCVETAVIARAWVLSNSWEQSSLPTYIEEYSVLDNKPWLSFATEISGLIYDCSTIWLTLTNTTAESPNNESNIKGLDKKLKLHMFGYWKFFHSLSVLYTYQEINVQFYFYRSSLNILC